jgi:tetratricopeptide (TPR) repeat protein
MWIVACALTLAAATSAPPDTTPQADPSRYPSLEALRRYASGRLLAERGATEDALGELYRALVADPRASDILRDASELNLRTGEPARALELADRALEGAPDDARTQWLRGAALFQVERYPDALAALQRATALVPDEPEYQRTLARAAEQLERWDVVAGAWRSVLEQEDDDAEAWFQLGAAEGRLGHYPAADSALAIAQELNPHRPGLDFLRGLVDQSLGRAESAVTHYRRHLSVHDDDDATRRRLVELLAQTGHWGEAHSLARRVARDAPDDAEAAGIEIDLGYRAGRASEARAGVDRLLARAPDDPTMVARGVMLLARHERGREGAVLAETWARSHADDPRGAVLAARARALAGDWTLAEGHARRAIEAAPDSLEPRVLLARLRQEAGRWAAAESSWTDVLRRFPDRPRGRLDVAYCRERGGDPAGAEALAREELSARPDDPVTLNFLGYLLADRGERLEEALGMIRRALEQQPENGAFIDSMGWVYYRMGRLAEARAELERALRITGGDPEVHEHLGDVYKDLQLKELAREHYRLALADDPANARLKRKLGGVR